MGSQVRVLLRPPTQESPCKIRDFLLFCPLPQEVQNEHADRVHSVDVIGLCSCTCSHRVDVNGLAVRVASLLVFDVNRLPARLASLPVFDVNGSLARCERLAG